MASNYRWELNASTGNSLADLPGNRRLVRLAGPKPYLYCAEWWGPLIYPICSTWERTPKAALAALDTAIEASVLPPIAR